jgi:GT2 family glycosyltransferase
MPTFNRLDRLPRVLDAIERQTLGHERYEVVVVSDGSTDGTDEYLATRSTRPGSVIRFVTQPNGGPSAARNRGIEEARGKHVVFVDDDIVADPHLLERHLAAQLSGGSVVAMGPMLIPDDFELSPWVRWEQDVLYKQYDAMRDGHYEPTFRQFYTGNASAPTALLRAAGGFDLRFRRAEDVELGYRLHQLGARFVFDPEAKGFHHAERRFESSVQVTYDYGRNDVAFLRDHQQDWINDSLPDEFGHRNPLTRRVVALAVPRPWLRRIVRTLLVAAAKVSFRLPVQPVTNALLSGLHALQYYSGLADEAGDPRQAIDYLAGRRDSLV